MRLLLRPITDYTDIFKCRLDYVAPPAPSSKQWTLSYQLSSGRLALCTSTIEFYFQDLLEEHTVHVCSVLALLSSAGTTLELKKRCIFAEIIDFPGHVIRPDCL